MRDILLGVDIGTSACKAAAFDGEGRVMAQAAGAYDVSCPHPGWAEQDPEQWWEAVCRAIREVLEKGKIDPARIAGVGVDGQSWSAIAVDHDGRVLCPTPIWYDTRAAALCEEINHSVGEERLFAVSGNPFSPSYTMPKVIWYRRERPQVYENAWKILQSNGYLVYRLTGAAVQDESQGYGWP